MINLNEIAFIDTDGFDYNDGERLIRFDTAAYYPDKKQITFAVASDRYAKFHFIAAIGAD